MLVRALDDGVAALAVADGVGGRPCDWAASEATCRVAMETFTATEGTLPGRLEAAVQAANRRVRSERGGCAGMRAALVMATWRPGVNQAHCVGVGDARVYRIGPERIEQLTQDDVVTEMVRPDPRTSIGRAEPFERRLITRSIGWPRVLPLQVHAVAFPPGAGLVLVSDGLYPLEAFETDVRRAYETGNLQDALEAWLTSPLLDNYDDATVAVLRRKGLTPAERAAYVEALRQQNDPRVEGLAPHLMLSVILEALHDGIAAGAYEQVEAHLSYLETYALRPARADLVEVLDALAAAPDGPRSLFDRLVEMIRRLR